MHNAKEGFCRMDFPARQEACGLCTYSTRENQGGFHKKVIHCGRATGGTVDKSSGGWTELKQFAQRREEKTNA